MQAPVFPGDRVGREDSRYPTMVRGFNLRWVGRPEYVQVCGEAKQVVAAVQAAVGSGKRVTVRCGGHCYEDFVCDNDGGVIIDLSPMSEIYLAAPGIHCVEGGATLWNVYQSLYRKYGVTLPGGSCCSVGIGSHVTGGGYGLLSRLHGLTIDYLYAVEIVVVDGKGEVHLRRVSADSADPDERDLLWANQGGGGGNFGIVTRFFFKDLPTAPTQAWLSSQSWQWKDLDSDSFGELIARYGKFLQEHSEPNSPFAGLFSLLHLYRSSSSNPAIKLTSQYVGKEPQLLEQFVRTIAGKLPIKADSLQIGAHRTTAPSASSEPLPWLFATQTLNGSGPNRRGKYKSAYMVKPFPEHQIETMYEHLRKPSPNQSSEALLQIDSYGCKVNSVGPQQTAIPQRSSIMKLQYQAYWEEEGEGPESLSWIGDFYREMYGPDGPAPDGTMDGCYVNYPDVDLVDWQHLYYKECYPRLQRVKARWDPLNIFRHKQSIEPA